MKILQAINSFKYAWSSGGAARVAYDISSALTKKGYEVMVFTTNKGLDEKYHFKKNQCISLNGIKTYYFKNLSDGLAKKGFSAPLHSFFVARRKILEFDVIHIHEFRRMMNIFIHHYARKYNVPYILQVHGSLLSSKSLLKQGLSWIFDMLFGYRLLRDASKVIALSRIEVEQYRDMGVPEEKIKIIPNGIDLSEYTNLPPKGSFKKKYNILESRKIILYLGRIHKTKGIDLLINAYAKLTKKLRYNNAILVIAGPDDGCLAEVKFLTNSLGISDSVQFTGFLNNKDKLGALADADVFVTPSFYGFPLTFLESCATGTPIITTTLGDTLEWINGNVGYVVSATSYDLANAICAVISDDGLHRKFSSNCMKVVESKFSLEKVVDRLEQIYREIAER